MKKGRLRPILGNGRIRYDWWKSVLSKDFIGLINRTGCGGIVEGPIRSVTGKSFPFGKNHEKKLVVEKFMKTVEYCPIGENIVDFIEMFQMVNFCLIKLAFLKLLETVQCDPINWNKYVLSNCFKWSFSLGLVNKIFVELLETVDFVRFIAKKVDLVYLTENLRFNRIDERKSMSSYCRKRALSGR